MNKEQKREYKTIVLGALLHDIGKFMNRAGYVQGKHPIFSADYVSSNDFKKLVNKEWLDLNLLKTLVQRHHEYVAMPEDLLVQKIDDDVTRTLAYIVSRADTYSSGERLDEEPSDVTFKKARLRSILTRVNIGKGDVENRYYNIEKISPKAAFPVADHNLNPISDYDNLLAKFGSAFDHFKPAHFEGLFNGYLSLFEEYLWCVPSDTRDKSNDISLFDHLSTTSAIAACLYQYHCDNLKENLVKKDNEDKFMLVAGDLSGIQKFIFEIGTTNPKKLSKILRGRSFYVSILTELASLKILKHLDLPISCRIMNAGGKFVLLVPNLPSVKDEINKLKGEVDNWFYERFLGKLSLNIVSDIKLSGKDFCSQEFSSKNDQLVNELDLAKKRKFEAILKDGTAIDSTMREAYKKLKDNKPCEFCKIYPKIDDEYCQTCADSITIGKNLIKEKFLYFYKGEKEKAFNALGYSFSFCKISDEWILLENIGGDDNCENNGYIKRYISNYIPDRKENDIDFFNERPSEGDTLCRYCGSPCKLEDDKQDHTPARKELVDQSLTFQCMSASARKKNDGKSVDHLAVIKADIDDLGFVFSKGFETKDNDQDKEDIRTGSEIESKKSKTAFSISRYASLSRMLNYFFSGWLTNEIEENFRMTYTVFAGGDDLMLIAPWEDALVLASKIGVKFCEYVGTNPNLTISMGINLMRPSSPVGFAAKGAEEFLRKSKEDESDEKNRITVFNTTTRWDNLKKLKEFMEILDKYINGKESKLNTSFLYRLLKYHQMYLSYEEHRHVEGLKFHSAMARDVYRNIEQKNNNGKTTNSELLESLLPLYSVVGGFNKDLMTNLKIPVFWTLYKNRGGEK